MLVTAGTVTEIQEQAIETDVGFSSMRKIGSGSVSMLWPSGYIDCTNVVVTVFLIAGI